VKRDLRGLKLDEGDVCGGDGEREGGEEDRAEIECVDLVLLALTSLNHLASVSLDGEPVLLFDWEAPPFNFRT
jgi:hypothetical protein